MSDEDGTTVTTGLEEPAKRLGIRLDRSRFLTDDGWLIGRSNQSSHQGEIVQGPVEGR